MADEGPRRISDKVQEIDIKGYLCPFKSATQPLALSMPGTDDLFLAVFSTEGKLLRFLWQFDLKHFKIVQINDGPDFLESITGHYRVMIDPYKNEDGRIRFIEPLPPTKA